MVMDSWHYESKVFLDSLSTAVSRLITIMILKDPSRLKVTQSHDWFHEPQSAIEGVGCHDEPRNIAESGLVACKLSVSGTNVDKR